MKRFLALTAALLLIFSLVSCGEDTPSADNDVKKTDYYLEYNGVRIDVGAPAQPTISQLGSYTSEDGEACGTDEKDVIYTFSGFEIETHVKGSDEYIRLIKILNDGVLTHREITIGDGREKVIHAYGKDYTEGAGGAIRYEGASSTIEFHFGASGSVSNIYIRMK